MTELIAFPQGHNSICDINHQSPFALLCLGLTWGASEGGWRSGGSFHLFSGLSQSTNMIELTWARNPVTKSCTAVVWLSILGHMVKSNLKIRLRPGMKMKTGTGRGEGGQSCGGHIRQRHIYYFTTALRKEAAFGLCRTHSTNDNHRGDSVNIEEWASNVQGETMTFKKYIYKYILFHLLLVCMVCRFISLWSHTVQIMFNILVQACVFGLSTQH